MNDSHKLLADYAEHGSESAFTELVQRYLNFVYSTALRLTDGQRHLAEDITQIVFTDLARSARTLSKQVMLGGWLHRHACFVAAKNMRAERRRRKRERQAAEMNEPRDHTPANIAEIGPELDDAINQLKEEDRLAILLRFFEQRDFGGVGAELGISEEAARKRVSRALEKLHANLTRHGLSRSAIGLGAALGAGLAASGPTRTAAEIAASALAVAAMSESAIGLKVLAGGKIKLATLVAGLVAAMATPLYVAHRSESALRQENSELRTQVEQLTALEARIPIVASPSPQPAPPTAMSPEYHELMRLRGEAGVLRDQLAKANQARTVAAHTASPSAQSEPADISLGFTRIPLMQLLDIYKDFSGKALTISADVQLNKALWLKTPPNHPLTRSQAILWTEQALKDQANVLIVSNADGSISAVPAPAP